MTACLFPCLGTRLLGLHARPCWTSATFRDLVLAQGPVCEPLAWLLQLPLPSWTPMYPSNLDLVAISEGKASLA